MCTGTTSRWRSFNIGGFTRAIAFGIYRLVTPAKAGVQRPQDENNGRETADFRRWIPAFAGMTVAGSAGPKSQRSKCDCPGGSPSPVKGEGIFFGRWLLGFGGSVFTGIHPPEAEPPRADQMACGRMHRMGLWVLSFDRLRTSGSVVGAGFKPAPTISRGCLKAPSPPAGEGWGEGELLHNVIPPEADVPHHERLVGMVRQAHHERAFRTLTLTLSHQGRGDFLGGGRWRFLKIV